MSDDEKVLKKIESVFKINSIRTTLLGGTVVSLDPAVGYPGNGSNSGQTLDAKQYLNLFHELADIEKQQGNINECVGLSTIWNVGFTTTNKKLIAPEYFQENARKYLENRKLRTVDQLFSRRSGTSVPALFTCFKLNGSVNAVIDNQSTNQDIDEFKRYGLICSRWLTHPQTIYYVMSIKSSDKDKQRDHLYIVAGDDKNFFKPNKLMEDIFTIHNDNATYGRHLAKKPSAKNVISIAEKLTTPSGIWNEFNFADSDGDEIKRDPAVLQALNQRKLIRTIQGVFNFYNYLIHTQKHLKLPEINEICDDGSWKSVKIVDLIKEWEPVYHYCKNLLLYEAISNL